MTLTQIVKRVDYWQHHKSLRHLGLGHWRFIVKWHDECEVGGKLIEEAVASATPSPFYDDAVLTFSEEAFSTPDFEDDEDRVIVHELLHIAMRDLDEAMEADLKEFLPPPVQDSHEERVRHAKEWYIDALSRVIVSMDRASK